MHLIFNQYVIQQTPSFCLTKIQSLIQTTYNAAVISELMQLIYAREKCSELILGYIAEVMEAVCIMEAVWRASMSATLNFLVLQNVQLIKEMRLVLLVYGYYFNRCLPELAELVSLPCCLVTLRVYKKIFATILECHRPHLSTKRMSKPAVSFLALLDSGIHSFQIAISFDL